MIRDKTTTKDRETRHIDVDRPWFAGMDTGTGLEVVRVATGTGVSVKVKVRD
jgi:hypothetical protein